ncbi:hypothetical protein DFH08DRAFT_995995 [Mycena albidolilacea]|uniref:Uncharacterized protein n=1 Tax=Mycena albidolilacea TaxID=1033008 RepID=A0AAD7A760_9AGAR|nr:hypothetical protein DFH08DRAFT_995995 [Mycena albidolilacea]
MALPARFTPRNLTGRFILNPTLSDVAACEKMLEEQSIADPALRRAVVAGVLSLNHYEDEIDGVERMWVQQDSGGKDCDVAVDFRVFDWQDRTHEDALFGPVVGRMRRITTDTLPDLRALPPLLRGGWTQETRRCGVLQYQYQFHRGCSSDVATERSWVETWGIESSPDGERRFARHVSVAGTGVEVGSSSWRLVYDYLCVEWGEWFALYELYNIRS